MVSELRGEYEIHVPYIDHVWGVLIIVRNNRPEILISVVHFNYFQGWCDFQDFVAGWQWQHGNSIRIL